jgi:hypothetical protein
MSMLDQLREQLAGRAGTSGGGQLLSHVVEMLQGQDGKGLNQLVQSFQEQGLGPPVNLSFELSRGKTLAKLAENSGRNGRKKCIWLPLLSACRRCIVIMLSARPTTCGWRLWSRLYCSLGLNVWPAPGSGAAFRRWPAQESVGHHTCPQWERLTVLSN